ncbi:MAG: hypothetical protein M3540_07710 [Actinomycetota bacterium]|nr:hypothetical protein [Actinomycetota bacterium]
MSRPLFDPGPPNVAVTLTDRQAFVLEQVRRTEGGLTADEAGALLHERRGKHDAGVRCEWCAVEGRGALNELRRKGLVVRRRSGHWQAIVGQAAAEPVSAQTDEIPF